MSLVYENSDSERVGWLEYAAQTFVSLIVSLLCVVTYNELHASPKPYMMIAVMFMALVPVVTVKFASQFPALQDASIGRFLVMYLVALLALLMPQFSIDFRAIQYEFVWSLKEIGIGGLFPLLASFISGSVAVVSSILVQPNAAVKTRLLYFTVTFILVWSLFLLRF